ncbi:hypothetical protein [Nocardioides humi]
MRTHFLGAVVATTAALLGLGTLAAPAVRADDPTPIGTISGTVTAEAGGAPLSGITVAAWQEITVDGTTGWGPVAFATTGATGTYTLYGSPGEYRLQFLQCTGTCTDPAYAPEFYDDVATLAEAAPLTIADHVDLPGIDAALSAGHAISGTVTGPDAEAVNQGTVTAYVRSGDEWRPTYTAPLTDGGGYLLVVPDGSYRVGFAGRGRNYAREYYADAATLEDATTITTDGADVPDTDAQLDLVQVQNIQGVEPTINGVPRVGDTLVATPGAWLPQSDEYAYHYAWFRSGSAQPIGTGSTLVVPLSAQGETVTVQVSATLTGYTGNTATSAPTAPIAAAPTALQVVAQPTIAGTAQVGRTLTVTPGTWETTPTQVSYAWLADGRPIPGATGASHTLTPDLLGTRITVMVSAVGPGSLVGVAFAGATSPVQAGTLALASAPALKGKAKVGRKLKVVPGRTLPTAATVEIRWLVRNKAVAGATKKGYKLKKAVRGVKVRAEITYTVPGYAPLVVRTKAVRVR